MRDKFEGTAAGAFFASEPPNSSSGSEESRRLFLDVLSSMASYDGVVLLEDVFKDSQSGLEDVCAVLA